MKNIGSQFTFPDTSNTRFGSHCEAAGVLLKHLSDFYKYLEFAIQKKQNRKPSHMEKNLWNALHDQPTLTELAVLALYAQSISHPYMRVVRKPDQEINMLDLGSFHHKVLEHMNRIIENPDLLLDNNSSSETGALDGLPWESAEIFQAIQKMKTQLPHFQSLLVEFFKGAADTWKRFISEFAPGGLIDESTADEKDLAWMPATNDANEGALGSFRVLMRSQPQLTVLHYNAQRMFQQNDTEAFMATKFTQSEDHQFIRKEARKVEFSKMDKKRKQEIIVFHEEKITQKKEAAERKEKKKAQISQLELVLDKEKIQKLAGQKLKDQLAAFKAAGAPNLNRITARTRVGEIRTALITAVSVYENDKTWDPFKENGDERESIEVFDFNTLEDLEGEDWEYVDNV